MESWEVTWTDTAGETGRREFRSFLEAWTFNEERLKGRGEVVLLTDRPLLSDRFSARTEAEAASRLEGGRRYVRRRRKATREGIE
jgi:hypothetical protein